MWIIYGHINLNKKKLNIIFSTAIERHAHVPPDNLPNNRIKEHKPDVFDFCCP